MSRNLQSQASYRRDRRTDGQTDGQDFSFIYIDSVCNMGYSVCNMGYSVCNMGYSVCNVGYSVCNMGYSVCMGANKRIVNKLYEVQLCSFIWQFGECDFDHHFKVTVFVGSSCSLSSVRQIYHLYSTEP